jgi:phosphatidate cytidylyltransferase
MNETLVRIITGAGLLVMVISGTLLGTTVFLSVFGIVAILCLVEYFNVTLSDNDKTIFNTFRKVLGVLLGMMPFGVLILHFYGGQYIDINPLTLTVAIIPFFLLMVFELFAKAPDPIKNIAFTGFGILYIGIPFMMMVYLQELYNPNLILGIIMLVFMYDSLAYVFGKWKGKTPLFPRISPKKTWEGAIGGTAFTFGLAASYPFFFFLNGPYFWDWMIIASMIVVLAPIGDLTESMLKRNFNIKDTGSLLPGHGGFLDRFDALIFVIPFILIYFLMS